MIGLNLSLRLIQESSIFSSCKIVSDLPPAEDIMWFMSFGDFSFGTHDLAGLFWFGLSWWLWRLQALWSVK